MNILTPKGQANEVYYDALITFLSEKYRFKFISMQQDKPSRIDGVISTFENIGKAVFEAKCRNMSKEDLERFGSWILTYDKIKAGSAVARLLSVPFIGYLHCKKDSSVFSWIIADSEGKPTFEYEVKQTVTKKNINGGEKQAVNAFLPIEKAKFHGFIKNFTQ